MFSTGKEKKKIFKDKRNGKSFEPVVIYSQVDDTLGEKVSLVYFKDECTQTYIANLFFESNACAILNSNNPNVLMCKALPKKAVLTFTFKKNNKTIESIIENSGASYYLYRPLYMTKDQKGFDLLSKVVMADPSFPKTNEEWVAAILLEVKWKAISETMDTMMDVINNYFSIIMSKELEKRNQEYLTKITNNQATLNSLTVGDLIQQVNPSYGYNNGFGAYTAFGYGEQSKDFCTYISTKREK